ncbi:MAG TPA: DnaJ domain-containing protein, partial [Thermoanaerobaculia bacterium]|nr:DnaJ domain-containing protein [Thermoanaerobaculia bacterium]
MTGLVRRIHRERRSGTVEVELPEGRRRLAFLDGEMHLAADHPLAARLAPLLPVWPPPPERAREAAPATAEVRALMARIAFLLASWDRGEARLVPEGESGAEEGALVGPLPTVFLLMEWAAAIDEEGLLAELGGSQSVLSAREPEDVAAATAARLLDPHAAVLYSRLGRPTSVADLLRQSGTGRTGLLADVARLRAAGLVSVEAAAEAEDTAAVPALAARAVPPDVLRRYAERIRRDLDSRPLALDPESHRSRVADLLTRSGGASAYELLGVGHAADGQEVHEAYVRLARVTHPRHAARLELAGGERPLWLLFEQVTGAYLTLSQPERRRRYDARLSIVPEVAPPVAARPEEERRLARSYYERAAALVDAEDFHFAVELLRQAVHTHPRPEYYVLLGRVQAKNPNWLRHALDSYRRAMELGADDPRISVALGRICEEMGQADEARRHFEAALARAPSDPEARAGMARL